MGCILYRKYISAYIDNELSPKMGNKVASHMAICNSCTREYEELLAMEKMMAKLPQYEPSYGFMQCLKEKIEKEERIMSKKSYRKKVLVGAGAVVVAVLIIFISMRGTNMTKSDSTQEISSGSDMGISSERADIETESAADLDADMEYGEIAESEEGAIATDVLYPKEEGRKLIRSANLVVETLDFGRTIDGIMAKTNMMQGYVEGSNIHGIPKYGNKKSDAKRWADLEIRIPSKNFERFMDAIGDVGHIINKETFSEDVTAQYFDTEARLKSLKIQEERLLTLLSKAEKLQDIIEIERELSQVRYEIENYTGTLKKWDALIDYSSVYISVYEVETLETQADASFAERVSVGFVRSINNLSKFFKDMFAIIIIGSPYILLAVILIWLIKKLFIDRRRDKKKTERVDNNE